MHNRRPQLHKQPQSGVFNMLADRLSNAVNTRSSYSSA
jgi:hypothetical protein